MTDREQRARAQLDAYGWQSTLEQGAAFVRMMLAFEDAAYARAAFRMDELAIKADAEMAPRHAHAAYLHAARVIRAMKRDPV